MAVLSRINLKAKQNTETGLGTNSAFSGGRFLNKGGDPNVIIHTVMDLSKIDDHELITEKKTVTA